MFKNLGISMRMLISVSVVVVLYAATFLVVGTSLSHLAQEAVQADGETIPNILLADKMIFSRLEVRQHLTDVSASHNPAGYRDAEESAKRFMSDAEKYKQLFRQRHDENKLQQIEAIETSFNRFYASGKIMAAAYLGNSIDAGNQLLQGVNGTPGFEKDSETVAQQLTDFREQLIAETHTNTSGIVSNAKSTMMVMIIGGLIASLSAAFFAAWITRSVLGKMGGEPAYAAEVVKRVSEGDLTVAVNIKANDDNSMLFAVQDMIRKISVMVANIRHNTESIATATQEIATGNTDLSQRTEQQAASLEETASSMEELLSAVRENAESAKHAYQLAQGSCDISEQSGKEVEMLVATMNAINESSSRIHDIISVIDGIAFQTNILALNAAVEAARAGEQGRGFAVVATEVRNLAQRSASAAKEIKQLISGSMQNVDIGSKQVKDAAETINDVVTSVQLVASLMKDISAKTTEQSMSIEQVNTAITQMDDVTQQNAALVEQAAAATESMQEQAAILLQDVSIFKLTTASAAPRKASPALPKTTPPHLKSSHTSTTLPTRTHKLAKAVKDDDSDWKEF